MKLVKVTEGRNRGRTCVIGDRKPDEMPRRGFKGAKATKVAAGCFANAADARAAAQALAERAHVPKKGKLHLTRRRGR